MRRTTTFRESARARVRVGKTLRRIGAERRRRGKVKVISSDGRAGAGGSFGPAMQLAHKTGERQVGTMLTNEYKSGLIGV
ncbi:hypothetical protein PSAC2689_40561 [Paraburkholderia sacchari]